MEPAALFSLYLPLKQQAGAIALLATAALCATWRQAPAQARDGASPLVYEVEGRGGADFLGYRLAVLGDVDGDSVKDFAVASKDALRPRNPGRVDLLSGKDGKVLRSWFGQKDGENLGWLLAALPDLDADGIPELAVGTLGDAVNVISPTGDRLWYTLAPGADEGAAPGRYLFLADMDGDRIPEFGYGARGAEGPGGLPGAGEVGVRSGANGRLLWRQQGSVKDGGLGASLVPAGDHDGDGIEDILVGEPCYAWVGEGPERPGVHIFNARTGDILRTFRPAKPLREFGTRIATLGVAPGQRMPRVAVAAPEFGRWRDESDNGAGLGWVGVLDLEDFRLVRSWTGLDSRFWEFSGDLFGYNMALAGDADGDGAVDLLVGTTRHYPTVFPPWFGRLYLYSGRTLETLEVYEGVQLLGVYFEGLFPLDDVDGDGRDEFIAINYSHTVDVSVGQDWPSAGAVRVLRYLPDRTRFLRGDVNGDGRVNISDLIFGASIVVQKQPWPCEAAADFDGSGEADGDDIYWILEFLFRGPIFSPSPPFPECGRWVRIGYPASILPCEDPGACRSP